MSDTLRRCDDYVPPAHPMRRADDAMDKPTIEIKRWERWLIPLVSAAVFAFVLVMAWTIYDQPAFQPLTFEVQRVVEIQDDGTEQVPQVEGEQFAELIPSVAVGDIVPVVGRVCNDHREEVNISGIVQWNRLSPRGLNIEVGRGTNTIVPGCRVLGPFENDMPQAVIDDVVDSGEPELWQISGVINIDESNGGQTFWQTEAFWIVP